MVEDMVKSIRATLYDRTSSPLFGSLAISWIAWNCRLFVVIFSEMTVQQKFGYIDTILYADKYWRWLPLALGPVVTTAVILFVYPWPAQWVYRFWRRRQKELKEIRQRIEDETPLTIQESRSIRRQIIEIQTEYEAQLNGNREEIARLKQTLTNEASAKSELSKLIAEKDRLVALKDQQLANAQNISALQAIVQESHPSADEVSSKLRSMPYRLIFNTKRSRATGSKPMLFGPDGKILEGNNHNEASWRVRNGFLELLNSAGEVHNRFSADLNTGVFTTTGDSDLKALEGQYMVPEHTAAG
jgi:hypothetical protein